LAPQTNSSIHIGFGFGHHLDDYAHWINAGHWKGRGGKRDFVPNTGKAFAFGFLRFRSDWPALPLSCMPLPPCFVPAFRFFFFFLFSIAGQQRRLSDFLSPPFCLCASSALHTLLSQFFAPLLHSSHTHTRVLRIGTNFGIFLLANTRTCSQLQFCFVAALTFSMAVRK